MEKYLEFLSDILSTDASWLNSKSGENLDEYFFLLEDIGYNKRIHEHDAYMELAQRFGENNIFQRKYFCENEAGKEQLQRIIIAITKTEGIEQKKNLIPLIIYVDINNVLVDFLLRNSFFDNMVDWFVKVLSEIKIDLAIPNDIPEFHHEFQLLKNYKEGINSTKIAHIYDFISAVEYGRGIPNNIFIEFSVLILYSLSLEKLIKLLDAKNDTINFITFVSALTFNKKLCLAVKTTNILLKFEILHECVRDRKCNFNANDYSNIEQIIFNMASDNNMWEQFLCFYLKTPAWYAPLFSPLAKAVCRLNKDKRSLFYEKIPIDTNVNENNKTIITNCINSMDSPDIKQEAIKTVSKRWEDFVEKENLLGLIMTDVIR